MNKDMENTFNQMAELGGSDERLGTNTTPIVNAPLLPMNTSPAATVEGLETVRYEIIETLPSGSIRWQCTEHKLSANSIAVNNEHPSVVNALVHRSQAEAIIAAERAENDEAYELGKRDGYSEAAQEIDLKTGGDGEYRYCTDHDPERHTPDPASMIQRIVERFETLNTMESVSEINEWKRRANEAEANNEALTARVKELSDLIDGENCADTDKIDALFRRAETAETQLTAAKDALEIVANAHASNPSLAMADVPEADYVRHVLYEMRKLARAALDDRS